LPVDFLIIVLLTTEFGMYSIISTMINPTDFSTSEPGFLTSILFDFIVSVLSMSEFIYP
jgi:hypothetical protein